MSYVSLSGPGPSGPEPVIGIDLGTTKSVVAYMDGSEPQVIPDEEGNVILPSVIGIGENGITVGDEARRYSIEQAGRTITSIKRFMGRSLSDVQDDLRSCLSKFRLMRVRLSMCALGSEITLHPSFPH